MPANCLEIHSVLFDDVDQAIGQWEAGTPANALPTTKWSTFEWLRFITHLSRTTPALNLAELDAAFHFTQSNNAEIQAAWYELAIHAGYAAINDNLEKFLTTVGRRKFLMPLYKELMKTPEGRQRAIAIYAKARPNYHSVATSTFDEMVK
jgi:hypothetical protein